MLKNGEYIRDFKFALHVFSILTLSACGEMALQPVESGIGPQPTLLAPQTTLIPTVNIAPAKGWPRDVLPQVASGMQVKAFASALDHPRWLYTLPNGDVLVAESNAPPKPDDAKGIKGWIMGLVMSRAGAGVPSANRITLLRDTDGDGVADLRSVLLEGLNSPFGMVLETVKLVRAMQYAIQPLEVKGKGARQGFQTAVIGSRQIIRKHGGLRAPCGHDLVVYRLQLICIAR